MQENDEISGKQERLIAFLLTERTIETACKKAEVAVVTYSRWMREESFLREYRTARKGVLENVIGRLQGITLAAIDALERNLTCENPSVEIRAAGIILEQAIRGLETLDVEQRLDALETMIAKSN
jgi:hypothetical protein